ncbi:MAG: triose-phosphate isomerase [Gammaproteobacteria bacterium]|nr:triose-phosphate isomerase [Gammaproteobacteria bacterium]
MRKPFVAGNWKMNGSAASAQTLAKGVVDAIGAASSIDVAVCPSNVFLHAVADIVANTPVALGAQDVSEHEAGAYTGETAAGMLKDMRCRYVLIGHSERRQFFGDTDDRVRAKFQAALAAQLTPIVCVGETLDERESGSMETVIARQVDAVLNIDAGASLSRAVVAYEPVWAIGTGKTASPAQAQEVHKFIRDRIAKVNPDTANALQVLYGGSVKPDNAPELFSMADIDGGLIGGAALDAEQFVAICKAAG